jgi:hypothetical protein
MNITETLKIFSVLKANYHNFFKNITKIDAEAQVSLWAEMFEDTPYEVVGMAVKSYIATNIEPYPPSVGQIKEQIRQLTQQQEMTEQEAVSLILKACSNSIYNSQEEFDKLPPTLQRLAVSPTQLREWATMDSDVLHSVVASNLMRSYKAIAEKERQHQALPSNLQNLIAEATQKMSLENNISNNDLLLT